MNADRGGHHGGRGGLHGCHGGDRYGRDCHGANACRCPRLCTAAPCRSRLKMSRLGAPWGRNGADVGPPWCLDGTSPMKKEKMPIFFKSSK